MGYTHYFTKNTDLDPDKFKKLSEFASKIIHSSNIKLAAEYDTPETPPVCNDSIIRFNGIGDDGHETFYLDKTPGFEFCKTVYKPYDLVVTAILTAAANIMGDDINVSSDGDTQDWNKGVDLANQATGMQFTNPIK